MFFFPIPLQVSIIIYKKVPMVYCIKNKPLKILEINIKVFISILLYDSGQILNFSALS